MNPAAAQHRNAYKYSANMRPQGVGQVQQVSSDIYSKLTSNISILFEIPRIPPTDICTSSPELYC